jgi:hypothetical protein
MIERFKGDFKALEGLSTEALDRSAETLVRAEKQKMALVIAHIAEMSRRAISSAATAIFSSTAPGASI